MNSDQNLTFGHPLVNAVRDILGQSNVSQGPRTSSETAHSAAGSSASQRRQQGADEQRLSNTRKRERDQGSNNRSDLCTTHRIFFNRNVSAESLVADQHGHFGGESSGS